MLFPNHWLKLITNANDVVTLIIAIRKFLTVHVEDHCLNNV